MPNENKLLTASGDQTVVLWDVKTEEKLAVFKGHTSSIKTARFGHENKCNCGLLLLACHLFYFCFK